ncbi:non-ribosomal peptide synthetase [Rhizohabitans arisaemae]|uniref:non-ribosomal peptide synthetase n=1 Tax=Rhizohabitans arisaemae TaxID=2720610 RepID=UPI0024B16D50|nr:amino acid adenylation domain-containing protein [Rhizohabitans arisaemae]
MTSVFPASYAQERTWFLGRLHADLAVYNVNSISYTLKLRPFDPEVFRRAFTLMVARHEALRTSFELRDDRVVQIIVPELPYDVVFDDLSGLPRDQAEAEFARIKAEEAETPIPLDRAPLWRLRMCSLGGADWRLLMIAHHAIQDAWSSNVLWPELADVYHALREGREPVLPELPIQYADYAVWQRGRLDGGELTAQLDYWRKHLAGLPAETGLPVDRPRPAEFTYRGDHRPFKISDELNERIAVLARGNGTTAFTVLLTAFKTLVARWSGQPDVIVGVPVSGRELPELNALVGMFVNTLPLRTDLGGDPTFTEALGRVSTTVFDGLDHQSIPFAKLVEELQPPRDPSRMPFFQVGFNHMTVEEDGQYLNRTTKTDLTLELRNPQGKIDGWIEYSPDLFDQATIDRLVQAYLTLLDAAVSDPDRPISALPLFDEAERSRLLTAWNRTEAAYPDRCLHELIAEQAARTPDAPAVLSGGASLTYRELDERAGRLAVLLRAEGVGRESPVAVRLPREPDTIVALFAVLKAGGCYVPLDPDYPADRLAFMLADSGAVLLLTHSALAPLDHPSTLLLDTLPLDEGPVDAPQPAGSPDRLAYVIYTSGSTGRPKGVMVPHRGVVNLVADIGFSAAERVLQLTSLSFDIAALEIFGPLLNGGAVVVGSGGLRELIATTGVTTVQAPPSVLQAILPELPEKSLRIFSGGEPLPPALAGRLTEISDEVWNLYGPTETTIWSCAHRIAARPRSVSIGLPVANTVAHVLDRTLRPVPLGVPGELCLGGDGLARGYHGRPGVTADRFVPDPFAAEPGRRLYRTGDLVRRHTDGTLEFLGRLDDQVKLRGVRIELGEVESVCEEHPLVRRAVAAVRPDPSGEQVLVAYVDWAGDPAELAGQLRAFLRNRLPSGMTPGVYLGVTEFPRLPNGKLNRAALPVPPDAAGAGRAVVLAAVPPETASEELVHSVWSEVLGHDRFGVEEDFFELGGHSLLAARVVARLCSEVGLDLPLNTLFSARSVRDLAVVVEERLAEEIDQLSEEEAERLLR